MCVCYRLCARLSRSFVQTYKDDHIKRNCSFLNILKAEQYLKVFIEYSVIFQPSQKEIQEDRAKWHTNIKHTFVDRNNMGVGGLLLLEVIEMDQD